MRVSELGEFGLIARLQSRIAQEPAPPASSPFPSTDGHRELILGIGDDCAVWRRGSDIHLATTDTMVQGVHFSLETTPWLDLGWKALAVNLSDIAAMAGIPDYALVTLGLPGEVDVDGIDSLYEGVLDCARSYHTFLAGGDIVSSPVWFVSVSLTGHPSAPVPYPNNVLLRSAARAGEVIAVTGQLGSSAAGLRLLQEGGHPEQHSLARAIQTHRRPVPRLDTGRLALEAGVRCGMDVSDGLVGDLSKICAASGAGAEVHLPDLPVDPAVREAFPGAWPGFALSGGEDYELLMTAPAEVIDAVRERSDLPLTVIGRVVPGEGVTVTDERGRQVSLTATGWDHLAAHLH